MVYRRRRYKRVYRRSVRRSTRGRYGRTRRAFRTSRRAFRTRFRRRRGYKLTGSRRFNKVRIELFRTDPYVSVGIPTMKTGVDVMGVNLKVAFVTNSMQRTLFKNKCLGYEQFKIISVQYHQRIQNRGVLEDQVYIEPIMWRAYDPDDSGKATSLAWMNNVKARMNCKLKTLKAGRWYKQTIKPRWHVTSGTGDVEMYRTQRHDNPWFDCDDFQTDGKIDSFPAADNCYKSVIQNNNAGPINIEEYQTWIIAFRGENRQFG